MAHAALVGPDEGALRGRAALGLRIGGLHPALTGLIFIIEVGPVTDGNHVVVSWRARGTYRGGFPSTSDAAVGREVNFTGTDILRVADGKIAEYWLNSDNLLLLAAWNSGCLRHHGMNTHGINPAAPIFGLRDAAARRPERASHEVNERPQLWKLGPSC